jgi:hypothetical protein
MERFVHNANIEHYRRLIAESEFDPSRDEGLHKMLLTLLAARRSSRYAEPGCRIRSGSSAICGLWPLVGDLAGYWLGIASFISGTKNSGRF